jgi:hypothetical protein
MKKTLLIIIILILLILLFWCACFRKTGPVVIGSKGDTVAHWINWNVLFTTNSASTSAQIIQGFEDSLTKFAQAQNPTAALQFHLGYCPCDSLLTNIDATVTYGAGQIVTPPPTHPTPGPKGDYTLGNNFAMEVPDYADSNNIDTSKLTHHPYDSLTAGTVSGKRKGILAVIDTGLDTVLFKLSYPIVNWAGNLLWQDASGKPTLFNVVDDAPTNMLKDNTLVKHGTAATQIMLTQMSNMRAAKIPRIMSIRAFDDSERGSIYSVSCAMSYAIKNQADYINASWGYLGPVDSVLRHYIVTASEKHIRIVAAAGNTPGHHDPGSVCGKSLNTGNSLDSLKKDTLFYPACFAPVIDNVVSVTQLNSINYPNLKPLIPCNYQNYSPNYITVGALEVKNNADPGANSDCCRFNIPFLARPIEGSSFATPVITALLMYQDPGPGNNIKSFINMNANHEPSGLFTDRGSFFNYTEQK